MPSERFETAVKRRVLVVEDEGLIGLELKKRLERSGFVVTSIASTAEEALNSARADRPEIVLMDIRIGGPRDGVDAANQMRRELRLPVVFVTAHADPATLARARVAEPFGYIVKPFGATNFEAKIEMAVWKHAMEQRLRESERWLAETMRHAGDGIITTDKNGNLATLNPAAERMTGLSMGASHGRRLCDVLRLRTAGNDALMTQADAALMMSSAGVWCARCETGIAAGRTVECTITTNREDEVTLGMIVVLRDVTDRLKAAEQEKQLNRVHSLALLATGAARELREPLRKIAAHTEECIHEAAGSVLRELRQVYRATSQAQSLVSQLAEMGRIETSGAELVDVNGAIAALQPRLRKLFGRSQKLDVVLEPGLAPIRAEQQGLTDSIISLVTGLQQASGAQGQITLTTESNDAGAVRISVSDTGPAISERARSRMFEPYYHSRAGQSDGLSLALVHHFVTVNGGSIEAGQTPAGTNRFCIVFPAAYPQGLVA